MCCEPERINPKRKRGLEVDSTHAGLMTLRRELGERRQPVLSFLPRRHALNRWLGMARHRLLRRGKARGAV